jgi:hypothetical protein
VARLRSLALRLRRACRRRYARPQGSGLYERTADEVAAVLVAEAADGCAAVLFEVAVRVVRSRPRIAEAVHKWAGAKGEGRSVWVCPASETTSRRGGPSPRAPQSSSLYERTSPSLPPARGDASLVSVSGVCNTLTRQAGVTLALRTSTLAARRMGWRSGTGTGLGAGPRTAISVTATGVDRRANTRPTAWRGGEGRSDSCPSPSFAPRTN